jgi:hypothetical protein
VIDHLHNHNHALELRAQAAAPDEPRLRAEIADGTGIIERLSRLKYEMGRDRPLACVPPAAVHRHAWCWSRRRREIADDSEPHVELYNAELARLKAQAKDTWFTAPWLFAE